MKSNGQMDMYAGDVVTSNIVERADMVKGAVLNVGVLNRQLLIHYFTK